MTNGKEEVLKNYPVDKPPLETLTQTGYVVLAIDAYGFGERQHQGPAGDRESGQKNRNGVIQTVYLARQKLYGA